MSSRTAPRALPRSRAARLTAVCASLLVAFVLAAPMAARAATPATHAAHHSAKVIALSSADQHSPNTRLDQPCLAAATTTHHPVDRVTARTPNASHVTTSLTADTARMRGPPDQADS